VEFKSHLAESSSQLAESSSQLVLYHNQHYHCVSDNGHRQNKETKKLQKNALKLAKTHCGILNFDITILSLRYWVSLYVSLHELGEGSSKWFKFHYLVSQSILLDTYFLFLPKKIFVSICGVLIFLVPNRGFTLENPN
jgi:hypothetical protein